MNTYLVCWMKDGRLLSMGATGYSSALQLAKDLTNEGHVAYMIRFEFDSFEFTVMHKADDLWESHKEDCLLKALQWIMSIDPT